MSQLSFRIGANYAGKKPELLWREAPYRQARDSFVEPIVSRVLAVSGSFGRSNVQALGAA